MTNVVSSLKRIYHREILHIILGVETAPPTGSKIQWIPRALPTSPDNHALAAPPLPD